MVIRMEVVNRKGYNYQEISEVVRLGNEMIICNLSLELSKGGPFNRVICKVTLSSSCLWASFHPLSSLLVVSRK
jgi:hypothetical protein